MAKNRYTKGELVHASGGHYDGIHDLHSGYGIITDIIDNNTGEFYDELDVITGCGDKNTNVTFKIVLIAQDYSFRMNLTKDMIIFDDPIKLSLNPNNVHKYTFDEFEKSYNKALENLNKKMNFFQKYRYTRDQKLEIILKK